VLRASLLNLGSLRKTLKKRAVLDLAQAVEALATYVEKLGVPEDMRRSALRALGEATILLAEHKPLTVPSDEGVRVRCQAWVHTQAAKSLG
jgi:hypothetical protein